MSDEERGRAGGFLFGLFFLLVIAPYAVTGKHLQPNQLSLEGVSALATDIWHYTLWAYLGFLFLVFVLYHYYENRMLKCGGYFGKYAKDALKKTERYQRASRTFHDFLPKFDLFRYRLLAYLWPPVVFLVLVERSPMVHPFDIHFFLNYDRIDAIRPYLVLAYMIGLVVAEIVSPDRRALLHLIAKYSARSVILVLFFCLIPYVYLEASAQQPKAVLNLLNFSYVTPSPAYKSYYQPYFAFVCITALFWDTLWTPIKNFITRLQAAREAHAKRLERRLHRPKFKGPFQRPITDNDLIAYVFPAAFVLFVLLVITGAPDLNHAPNSIRGVISWVLGVSELGIIVIGFPFAATVYLWNVVAALSDDPVDDRHSDDDPHADKPLKRNPIPSIYAKTVRRQT